MKRIFLTLVALLLLLVAPAQVFAKGETVKISIQGADLKLQLKSRIRRFSPSSLYGLVRERVPAIPDSIPTRPGSSLTGRKVRLKNRQRDFSVTKSRFGRSFRKRNLSMWCCMSTIRLLNRVMCTCPAGRMNGIDSTWVRFSMA